MRPGFQLNLHNRNINPCFESHDPSMMWDPVSETYYSYCTDTGITSEFKQGIPIRKSKDLVEFEFVGYALSDEAIAEGSDNGPDFMRTPGFWAPYVECVPCSEENEYRMYYSATKAFGSSESRIWLAVSKSPEGPFENRGVVMDTWNTPDTDPNAIDAHVCDTPDGHKFLIYGSFFGGIFVKELDPKTGMPINPNEHFQGKCIARKPLNTYIDGPEGPAIIYNPKTDFFYLFLSYGWLGDDYDIRVGRSKSIEGPYVDITGIDMVDGKHGTKLAGSYHFKAEAPFAGKDRKDWEFDGFRGPGHGVPFYAPKLDQFFFVHHVRDGAQIFRSYDDKEKRQSFSMHYMVVRQMFFVDGWPVFSPEPYVGEFDDNIDNSLYKVTKDAMSHKNEEEYLSKEVEYLIHKVDDNQIQKGQMAILKDIPEIDLDKLIFVLSFDFENSTNCVCFTGYTKNNEAIWGKIIK